MDNHPIKKIILLSLSLFSAVFLLLISGESIYAQPLPVTQTVSVSAKVGEEIIVTPGGGRSTGGIALPRTAVSFSGEAYPNATVALLKEGVIQVKVAASAAGEFSITLPEQYNSNIVYSLFAEDVLGNRSLLINYPIAVKVGFITELSGIRFAPTILTDKSEVRAGDYLTVSGYALPEKELEITVEGAGQKVFTLTSLKDGSYKIVLPLSGLPKGDYYIYIKYKGDLRASKLIKFIIGELNIFLTESLSNIPGDCNADKVINIIDFSILAFWYGRSNPPACVDTNKDKKINLIDFSILAFYWTG